MSSSTPREAIADALVSLVADEGFEAVSVRKVAERARVSAGLVQHYYASKQVMLTAAMERVDARFAERLSLLLRNDEAPAVEQLRALAAQLLPLDDDRAVEARVWVAVAARSTVDPVIRRTHSASWRLLEEALTSLVSDAVGSSAPARACADAAALLLATLDGLAVALVSEQGRVSVEQAERLAARQVDVALALAGERP
ncbi:TetR/AcrR family transcriptional regulator [Nocardioides hwasunensis]|uniref:TetR family transcriptional regulator C-terminal domain-containing protein n=1 Tax=Nocardioides hwasunensis TaxID=397258 RepID=A0ABR8MIX7_9ACTN|nr:TetR/AcrR family transcriptional regulator [Nocardioides hwasunensis]MBD3916003.1 TetR family transcriptional regulator C-terminal domain-containing protein [Nocardioides hwasunensis]